MGSSIGWTTNGHSIFAEDYLVARTFCSSVDATRIVNAVNYHDRLVAALRAFLQYEDGRELQQAETTARQLLTEIEG